MSFELLDYRAVDRTFDRIVSVGMFEHVGVVHYREFFDTVGRCLNPDGVALLHAIGRSDGPGFTNPWIAKYIFPGGYCPALSEVMPPVEKSGLFATDIEILRLHYAETLRHWRRRFIANRDTIASLYDERFCRMFEFYLCGSEIAFRREGHMVFQIQLAHQQTAVPLTRDYITHSRLSAASHVPGRMRKVTPGFPVIPVISRLSAGGNSLVCCAPREHHRFATARVCRNACRHPICRRSRRCWGRCSPITALMSGFPSFWRRSTSPIRSTAAFTRPSCGASKAGNSPTLLH